MLSNGVAITTGWRRNRTPWTAPPLITKTAIEIYLDSIPEFDPSWVPPDQAFTAFSWDHGAILLPYSGIVTPLKDTYLGQVIPQLPHLHVFSFGQVDATNDYTRVLEFERVADIPQGETNTFFFGTGGTFLRLYGEGGDQRLKDINQEVLGGYYIVPDTITSFRYPTSRANQKGVYYSLIMGGYIRFDQYSLPGEAGYPQPGLAPAFLAFDSANAYIRLKSGAQWDWAYRDDKPNDNVYTFTYEDDYLSKADMLNVWPTLSEIPAPPKFENGEDVNSPLGEPGLFEEGVTV